MDGRVAGLVLLGSFASLLATPTHTWMEASVRAGAWLALIASLLLMILSWRLPFYPASICKWALAALALPWPMLFWQGFFFQASRLAIWLYLIVVGVVIGLILLSTMWAMGAKPGWSELGARGQQLCRRYPILAWWLACLPLWHVAYDSFWFWTMGVGGVVVGGVISTARQQASVEKEIPDVLRTPQTLEAARTACDEPDGVFAGALAGIPLRIRTEDRASVIGPPGSGKTAFLLSQLFDWAESKRPFVCLDVKPELYGMARQRLEAQGYTLLAYNPTARAGQRYNLLADLESPEAIGELAAVLIPSPAVEDAVFTESARDLLDAVITHLRATHDAPTLPDVWAFLGRFNSHQGLLQTLGRSRDPDVVELAKGLTMVGRNPRLLGSIFATLRANLRFLRYPAVRDSLGVSDFRLSDLCQGKPVGLFLQFEEARQQTTALWFAAMVAHTLRYLIEHRDRPPVLLLFDEMGTVPPVPGLAQKLNTLRSRQLPAWLYWQSIEQMQGYGAKADEGPNLILGACDLQMVFRLNDNATAAWVSEKIGVADRVVRSVSLSRGRDWRQRETASASLKTEPIIRPHELQQLPAGEAVVSYRGLVWRGEAPAYFERWPEFKGKRPMGPELIGAPYSA